MSSIFLGMQPEQIRTILEDVDAQAEKKLEQTLAEALEKASKTKCLPGNSDNLYFVAGQIALAAFKDLENWAAQTFTATPSKELAMAWVNGSFHRFEGARSIQKEIRQILLK
ncbi:MAG TPA: hypothetical protein VMR37_03905 [Rhabdochlamydiaceae bacterium]|jgi:hypothetical protein|nr:hypothetical protein [Rhabdochlamydiaceae bacterium]